MLTRENANKAEKDGKGVTLTEDSGQNQGLAKAKERVLAMKPQINGSLKILNTGMFNNPTPIIGKRYETDHTGKRIKDPNTGEDAYQLRVVFGAGWQLSRNEVAAAIAIYEENKELNEDIYKQLDDQKIPYEKEAPFVKGVQALD